MRLLIVTQVVDANDPVLGFFVEWIRAFAAKCERVTVIARKVGPHDLPASVRVLSMGGELGAGKLAMLAAYWRHLAAETSKHDAIFVHMIPRFAALAWPFKALFRKPMALWYTHKSTGAMLKLGTACADVVFTASKESFRLASKKVEAVGHGIAPSSARRAPEPGKLRLLSAGRVAPAKGHDVAIRALGELVKRGNAEGATLDIVGAPALDADRAYEASLHALVRELGLADRVRFLGPVPHARMPEIFALHDLFLHASRTGGLDKVVLEAWSAEVPVISSSDAFPETDLASRYPDGDAAALAERIVGWRKRLETEPGAGARLAERVRKEHGLEGLIARLVDRLERMR